MAPLERTKILFQTRGLDGLTVRQTLLTIWRTEGLVGLYRGNGVSVLRIAPYAAIHFGSYEYYRRALVDSLGGGASGRASTVSPTWDLLAGAASGFTAVVMTYPLDLVRTRLAWQMEGPNLARKAGSAAHKHASSTIRGELANILSQDGVRGLYYGVSPTLMGILPYAGLKFYVYQSLKQAYRSRFTSVPGESSSPAPIPVGATLTMGGFSGLLAQTITYPLDVARRRMQVHSAFLQKGEVAPIHCSTPEVALPQAPHSIIDHPPHGSTHLPPPLPAQPSPTIATSEIHNPLTSPRSIHQGVGAGAAAPRTRWTSEVFNGRDKGPRRKSLAPEGPAACGCETSRQPVPAHGSRPCSTAVGNQGRHPPVWGPGRYSCRHHRLSASVPHLIDVKGANRPTTVHCSDYWTLRPPEVGYRNYLPPTTWQTLGEIVREQGIKGLFRGLSINYMKVVPSTAIGFTVYDSLKSFMELKGNL